MLTFSRLNVHGSFSQMGYLRSEFWEEWFVMGFEKGMIGVFWMRWYWECFVVDFFCCQKRVAGNAIWSPSLDGYSSCFVDIREARVQQAHFKIPPCHFERNGFASWVDKREWFKKQQCSTTTTSRRAHRNATRILTTVCVPHAGS